MTTSDGEWNITHTEGDTLDKTFLVKRGTTDFDWSSEGYSSATGQIRRTANSNTLLDTLTVDISVNGQLRITSTTITDLASGIYRWDIKFTKTDGSIITWKENRKFTIKDRVTA